MADYINNVACADNYTAALSIGPNYDATSCVVTVANNPVLMQFLVGKLGHARWTDEREFFSIPQSFQVGNVIGVKFRNANPGQVARVLAVLAGGEDDPVFESGIPFTGLLSASGAITPAASPLNGITGIVSGAGAILAGTGFSVVHAGVGDYIITPATPFSAIPIVLAMTPVGGAIYCVAYAVGAVSFHVVTINPVGPAQVDNQFNFIALVVQ